MPGEFAAISRIEQVLAWTSPPGETWIGDDAAVVWMAGTRMLLAADAVVAGIHADLNLTGLDDLGWKALAANVSDIAAMGGEVCHALVTVAGPPSTDLSSLFSGIAEAARHYGCPVVGGDLTNASVLVVTVAVTGRVDGHPVLRAGARPGDEIWVTAPLGSSAAGLRLLRAGADLNAPLSQAHARPQGRLKEGQAARRAGATAMIDISDGLSADLDHIASASKVGIALDRVPIAGGATLEEALGGGEDYELIFTAPPGSTVRQEFAPLRPPLLIGRCTVDRSERSLDGAPLPVRGWQHDWA
jgi:thiamine-monophosphate kinase